MRRTLFVSYSFYQGQTRARTKMHVFLAGRRRPRGMCVKKGLCFSHDPHPGTTRPFQNASLSGSLRRSSALSAAIVPYSRSELRAKRFVSSAFTADFYVCGGRPVCTNVALPGGGSAHGSASVSGFVPEGIGLPFRQQFRSSAEAVRT